MDPNTDSLLEIDEERTWTFGPVVQTGLRCPSYFRQTTRTVLLEQMKSESELKPEFEWKYESCT